MTWLGKSDAEAEGLLACNKLGRDTLDSADLLCGTTAAPQPRQVCGRCAGGSTGPRRRWRIPPVTQMNDFMEYNASLPTAPDPNAEVMRRRRLTAPEDENPRSVRLTCVLNDPSRKRGCGIHLSPLTASSVGYLGELLIRMI